MNTHDYLLALTKLGLTQKGIELKTGVSQPKISRVLARKQTDLSFSDGKKIEALHAELFGTRKAA